MLDTGCWMRRDGVFSIQRQVFRLACVLPDYRRSRRLSEFIRVNTKTEVGTMGFLKCHGFQLVVKVTPGIICTIRLQARCARSDAPYQDGLATVLFDSTDNFGVRGKSDQIRPNPTKKVLPDGHLWVQPSQIRLR
jgi:hypothetical protein